jgi:methyl-accepting chemotaxis protein
LNFLVLNYNKSLESKNYQTVQLLIIGFIFSVFVSVFISFLLGYLISKPIQLVEAMAKRFSKGDLTIQSEINSSDEIGRLSTSFFEAAQNLKNLIQEVQATATLVFES